MIPKNRNKMPSYEKTLNYLTFVIDISSSITTNCFCVHLFEITTIET